jgi:hypothetical protein
MSSGWGAKQAEPVEALAEHIIAAELKRRRWQ